MAGLDPAIPEKRHDGRFWDDGFGVIGFQRVVL
jgi:hypothetical protein